MKKIAASLSLYSSLLALLLLLPLSSEGLENITFSRIIQSQELSRVFIATPESKGHLLVFAKGDKGVLVLDYNGNFVTSFAVPSDRRSRSGLHNPSDIEIGPEGKIYISDTGNNRVVVFDKEFNYVTEIGERGSKRGQLNSPMGIKLDAEGNLYVADSGNNRVQVFNNLGWPVMTYEGIRTSERNSFSVPDILSTIQEVDNPYLDERSRKNRRYEPALQKSSLETTLSRPSDVAFDAEGNIYVADTGNGRVVVFNKTGRMSYAIGSQGGKSKEFRKPVSLLIDPKNRLYIDDSGNHKIGVLNLSVRSYQEIGVQGKKRGGEFNAPSSLSLDNAGNLYVADSLNDRIQVFSVGAPVLAVEKKTKEILLKEDVPVAVLTFRGIGTAGSLTAEMLTDLLKAKLSVAPNIRLVEQKDVTSLAPEGATFTKVAGLGAKFAVFGQVSENGSFTEVYLKIFNARTGINETTPQIFKIQNANYQEFIDSTIKQIKDVYAAHYLPPDSPTGFMAIGGDRKASLSWKKVEGIARVNVYRSGYPDTGFVKIGDAVEESYNDSGLEYGQTFYYQIRAVNHENIEGDPSAVTTATTFAAPEPVRKLKAIPLAKAVKLEWSKAPEIDPSGFRNVGYRIYRAPQGSDAFKEHGFIRVNTQGKENEFIDERLSEDSSYRYKVAVVNEKQVESVHNEVIVAKTVGYPKNFNAESEQPEKVTLHWDIQGSPDVDGYQIYVSENGRNFDKLTKISSRKTDKYVDGGEWLSEKKKSGTNYYYRITTLGPKGYETVESPVVFAKTKDLPLPPRDLNKKVIYDEEKKSLTLRISWEKSPTRDVDKYEIYRKAGDEQDFRKRGDVGGLASFYDDERIKEGDSFEYKVMSVDRDGLMSTFSSTISVTAINK